MTAAETVKELLQRGKYSLAAISPSAQLDAELLLSKALEKNRTWLKTWDDATVNPQQSAEFDGLIARRAQGEPIAYILGEQEFWSLPLKVTKATLIPRPETELLIEILVARFAPESLKSALDLGTGTGAIALAVAREFPRWKVSACDISLDALAVAKQNQRALNLPVELVQSDWFSAFDQQRFDIVVSNPPYIESDDIHLDTGDVRFEPRIALASGDDGFDDIRKIVQQSQFHLNPNGLLLFEHGYHQGMASRQILRESGYENVATCQDLAGHDRVTLGQKI